MCNKIVDFHHLIYSENFAFIFITESWLSAYVSNGILDPHNKYDIYRKDRDSRCGGVCACVLKNIPSELIQTEVKYRSLESVCFDVCLSASQYRFLIVLSQEDNP